MGGQLKDCSFLVKVFLGDGWYCSAGWYVLVRHTSHFSRTSNNLKEEKNTQHSEGSKKQSKLAALVAKMSISPEKATEWWSAELHWTTLDSSSSLLHLHPKIFYLQQLLQVAFVWPLTSPNHLSPHSSGQEAGLTWIKPILSYQKEKQGCEGLLGTAMVPTGLVKRTGIANVTFR